MERPMRDMLRKVAARTSLHMPAAQGRAPFEYGGVYRWDTTELPVTDDLYHPNGAIAAAQRLAAQSAGAEHTLLLPGGSTAGIQAMLLYACGSGGKVVLPRNAHLSVLNLCAQAGITPVFANPLFTANGRCHTPAKAYAAAMDEHPDAQAALAIGVDYYGLMDDLPAIARAVHARGKLLLCDEAHGASFNWRSDMKNAGARGADLFVQSAHKTLPALTPGAWLHSMPGVDHERLLRMLRMVQTSSPSFIVMQSLDDARAWMDRYGAAACARLNLALERFRARAARLGFTDGQDDAPVGCGYDRLRLVLRCAAGGEWLQQQLEQCSLDVEMADVEHVVCILSVMDGQTRLKKLLRALRKIAPLQSAVIATQAPRVPPMPAVWPKRRRPLTQAAFAPSEPFLPQDTVGRVCAVAAGRYPPGVAWLTPGDEITAEVAQMLANTPRERLFGLTDDGRLPCVTVEP